MSAGSPRACACLSLLIAGFVGCTAINSKTNAYTTLAEAREAGAIAQGWVPDGLPSGTSDIREAHLPGTSHRWGLFNFPPGEGADLRGLLASEPVVLHGARAEAPPRVEWWPLVLRGAINGDTLAAAGVQTYHAREGDLLFAVNWKQGRAYYWASQ